MKLLFLTLALFCVKITQAQELLSSKTTELPTIEIGLDNTVHFISPEPIQYVDISSASILGDLPIENILRIKGIRDSLESNVYRESILTIVGESFIAQYRLVTSTLPSTDSKVNILDEHKADLVGSYELTTPQMRSHALSLLAKRTTPTVRSSTNAKLKIELNHVYTLGSYIFLDLSFKNWTKLPYEIDQLKFKIEDKKIRKATNVQSIEIKPIWSFYPHSTFKRSFRNIYVLKKVSFHSEKILNVELSEKQLSGRTITLKIKYKDILNADTF